MQCRGNRGNGESFLAEVWFSSYKEGATPKLAAIIADVSEEQAVPVGNGFGALLDQKERPPLSIAGRWTYSGWWFKAYRIKKLRQA